MKRSILRGGTHGLRILTGAVLLAVMTARPATATVIAFNSSADLADFSGRTSGTIVGSYSWTNTVGVGSSGGAVSVDITSSSQDAQNLFYTAQTYQPSGGALALSVYFLAEAASSTSVSRNFVGFANSATTNLATATGKLGVRVLKNGSTAWSFQLQNGTSTMDMGTTFALDTSHWYRMSMTVTATGNANEYLLTGQLDDFGTSGTASPTLIRGGSGTFTNSTLGTDAAWNVGLLGQRAGGGALAFDNLSISRIPEPAGVALWSVSMGFMFMRRRCSSIDS